MNINIDGQNYQVNCQRSFKMIMSMIHKKSSLAAQRGDEVLANEYLDQAFKFEKEFKKS